MGLSDMSSSLRGTVVHFVRQVFHGHLDQASDAELLDRFIQRREEEAFAALVFRHQQLVFAVCYRTLANVQDAEDAFQATFLTLAKKCRSVRNKNNLGTWLYQVAYRASVRLRKQKLRRSSVETSNADQMVETTTNESPPATHLERQDEAEVIHEEIHRLPEKYLTVVVLCYLQGKTCTEVAEELGKSRGTIASRLDYARKLLRGRLTERGVSLSLAGLATTLSCSESLSKQVIANVVRASISNMKAAVANEFITSTTALLTKGVIDEMYGHITKRLSILAVVLCSLAVGGFVWYSQSTASVPKTAAAGKAKKAIRQDDEKAVPKDDKKVGKPKTDLEKIQGTWVVVSHIFLGAKTKVANSDHKSLTFQGNKVINRFRKITVEGTFQLAPKQQPKRIDMKLQGKFHLVGIYKFVDGQLVICGGPTGTKRPTEFTSEQPYGIIRYRRRTKKEKENEKHREFQKTIARLRGQIEQLQYTSQVRLAQAEFDRAEAVTKIKKLQIVSATQLVGTLKKIDRKENTATVVLKGTSLELKPVSIDENCKFYLGKKKCSIDDYKSGMAVRFSLQTKDNVTRITEIRATPKKK